MATSLDDSLWLGDRGGNQSGIRLFTSHTGLPKVKYEGNKLKVKYSFNIDIYDIATIHGNDLVIATKGS